jgi:hypothetical protein
MNQTILFAHTALDLLEQTNLGRPEAFAAIRKALREAEEGRVGRDTLAKDLDLLARGCGAEVTSHLADCAHKTNNAAIIAARREVIDELARVAANARWNDDRNMLEGVVKLLRAKYAKKEGSDV